MSGTGDEAGKILVSSDENGLTTVEINLGNLKRRGIDYINVKVFVKEARVEVMTGASKTDKILSFCFGFIFVSAILTLVVLIPNPSSTQKEVFRIVIAIAAGGIAAMIPGFIDFEGTFGISDNNKTFIRAGGALAVFVIVFFFSPAQFMAPP